MIDSIHTFFTCTARSNGNCLRFVRSLSSISRARPFGRRLHHHRGVPIYAKYILYNDNFHRCGDGQNSYPSNRVMISLHTPARRVRGRGYIQATGSWRQQCDIFSSPLWVSFRLSARAFLLIFSHFYFFFCHYMLLYALYHMLRVSRVLRTHVVRCTILFVYNDNGIYEVFFFLFAQRFQDVCQTTTTAAAMNNNNNNIIYIAYCPRAFKVFPFLFFRIFFFFFIHNYIAGTHTCYPRRNPVKRPLCARTCV